jgi:hypothetical protein
MALTRGSPQQKGIALFKTSPPALAIQLPVGIRFCEHYRKLEHGHRRWSAPFNSGDNNTATGALALLSNTTGFYSTADGAFALFSNTSGSGNTASGYQALYANHDGDNKAAFGYIALLNSIADFNTALGSQTLVSNTTGRNNTAIGYQALLFNTVGNFNIAIGAYAGDNVTTRISNIDIDNEGVAGEKGTIRVGQVRHAALWPHRRGSGRGRTRSRDARCEGAAVHRPLRGRERAPAQ